MRAVRVSHLAALRRPDYSGQARIMGILERGLKVNGESGFTRSLRLLWAEHPLSLPLDPFHFPFSRGEAPYSPSPDETVPANSVLFPFRFLRRKRPNHQRSASLKRLTRHPCLKQSRFPRIRRSDRLANRWPGPKFRNLKPDGVGYSLSERKRPDRSFPFPYPAGGGWHGL